LNSAAAITTQRCIWLFGFKWQSQ